MRILDNKAINVPLEALRLRRKDARAVERAIDQPHGIVLVTGPTGSGKTTTLYSSLRVMDGNKLNISTVEDPIEYQLLSANQVQVHEKIGMTFSAALRSLLRQDPDVVLLGEIRDQETARIAVQAALTGHLCSRRCTQMTPVFASPRADQVRRRRRTVISSASRSKTGRHLCATSRAPGAP